MPPKALPRRHHYTIVASGLPHLADVIAHRSRVEFIAKHRCGNNSDAHECRHVVRVHGWAVKQVHLVTLVHVRTGLKQQSHDLGMASAADHMQRSHFEGKARRALLHNAQRTIRNIEHVTSVVRAKGSGHRQEKEEKRSETVIFR